MHCAAKVLRWLLIDDSVVKGQCLGLHRLSDAAHMRPMARLLALCLVLIGLSAQLAPIAAEAMPAMHEDSAMVAMADCADCSQEAMSSGDVCQGTGGCAAGTAALDIPSLDWPLMSPIRKVRCVFGDAAPTGGCPAPLLGPPRRLI